jgi:hypothetical protein
MYQLESRPLNEEQVVSDEFKEIGVTPSESLIRRNRAGTYFSSLNSPIIIIGVYILHRFSGEKECNKGVSNQYHFICGFSL